MFSFAVEYIISQASKKVNIYLINIIYLAELHKQSKRYLVNMHNAKLQRTPYLTGFFYYNAYLLLYLVLHLLLYLKIVFDNDIF